MTQRTVDCERILAKRLEHGTDNLVVQRIAHVQICGNSYRSANRVDALPKLLDILSRCPTQIDVPIVRYH